MTKKSKSMRALIFTGKVACGVIGLILLSSMFQMIFFEWKYEGIKMPKLSDSLAFPINIISKLDYIRYNEFLQEYASNVTNGCKEDYCKIQRLYLDITYDFRNEVGEDHNSKKIIEEKAGDCDEKALTFVSLLKTLNIESYVKCTRTHCWSMVASEGKLYKIDLTSSEFRSVKNG